MAQFPQVPDLNLPVTERIGVPNMNVEIGKWGVANPHPGLGKDSNIGNEFGHTVYPKMIYKEDKTSFVVNNAEEEAIAKGETLNNGPTIAEWVAAGYKASAYPPEGYDSKSSDDEIKAAIEAEIAEAKSKIKDGWGK